MADLRRQVQSSLDEVRTLMLGAQVLLGFQYRAFFEPGYTALPPADRFCELAALAALLVSIGALFVPPARHRIVEHGNDSRSFHLFTMLVMRFALLPFAAALALDVAVAGDRILGAWGGAAAGTVTAAAALGFWYGHYSRRARQRRSHPEEEEMEKTPLEHRIVQVLTEARVVLPGAQALLGFQLAMVMMDAFARISQTAKLVHLASLGCIALATIVLISPAAYHRIVERGDDSERFHSYASRMILLALALLAPGFSGDLYVVLDSAGFPRAAWIWAAVSLLLFYAAWFGAMLVVRRRMKARLGAAVRT